MWNYSKTVEEHYKNPRNIGIMEDADTIGYAGSLACGDAITLFLKFDKEKKVEKASFLAYGCGSALAAGSIMTEIIIGKSLKELENLTNEDIVQALGGLPPEKIHCSVMCKEVVEYALKEYKNN